MRSRQEQWQHLEQLLTKTRAAQLKGLSADEILELGRLYRQATSDLAIARRDFAADRVAAYLQQLVGTAYPQVYRGGTTSRDRIVSLFLRDFPRAYRQVAVFVVVAFLLLVLPALIAYIATVMDPARTIALLPNETGQAAASLRQGRLWTDIPEATRPLFSSFIMANNIQVVILGFGGGVILGLGTIYVLVFNGITLGAIFGLCQSYGQALGLATFVAAHGFLELSAIFASAGAGLSLGYAILNPGFLSRKDALVVAGRRAIAVMVGCVPMLVTAGILEGFISPSSLPGVVKLSVGLSTGILLYLFLLFGGREKARERSAGLP